MSKAQDGYFSSLVEALRSIAKGLRITGRHLKDARHRSVVGARLDIRDPRYFQNQQGITTATFPHESVPVPETGRYKLDCEIDDCIVCDKCVKVCPVDCITIDPIRAPGEFGKTSDGTSKRIHAARFDIDMSKCCFCGLCTTVCPTECLTMTPEYDFSTTRLEEHRFAFAVLSEQEIEQRKKEWEAHLAAKEAQKTSATPDLASTPPAPKPVFRPSMKPKP